MPDTIPTPNDMPPAAAAVGGAAAPAPAVDPTPAAAADPAPAAPDSSGRAKPWGDDADFDPDKAWRLIENLRRENADIRERTGPIVEEHERLRRASQSDNERLTEDLVAAEQREAAWRNQAVDSTARALAAGRFIDADVAVMLVGDLGQFITDGRIDTGALNDRLGEIAADKPYLLAPTAPAGMKPNRAQQHSGSGDVPIDTQIKAAQDRGDVMTAIALKQQKRYAQ